MGKTGNLVSQRQAHGTDVFGVRVRVVETNSESAITRRDTLRVLQRALDIGERQSRAAVSSYRWEGWTWGGRAQ